MIQVKWFPNKNSWRNLWGMLGDVQEQANAFLRKYGTRGNNGVHVSPTGVYITYEDGVFSVAMQEYVLHDQLLKNKTSLLSQEVVYKAVVNKINETEERLVVIQTEVDEKQRLLDEDGTKYKELKPEIDILKAERDYLVNVVLTNAKQQAQTTKADMDRLDAENVVVKDMLQEIAWR